VKAGADRHDGEHHTLLLGALLGSLATLLVAASFVGGTNERRAAPPPARSTTATTTATPKSRSTVHGQLVAIDAQDLVLQYPDHVHVVPIQTDTQFCRITCRDTWADLQTGDDVLARVKEIGTVVLTSWVEANSTAGWVVVDAVDGDRLSVRWAKPSAFQTPFTLVIGPDTRWNTESRGPEPVCPGAQVHMVGGEQEADVVSAWTLSPGSPAPSCPSAR